MVNTISLIVFWLSVFLIFWAMIGYPAFLFALSKIKKSNNKKDYSYFPTVTILIVAHNEERVIKQKLENVLKIKYPEEKIQYVVASDNSSDATDDIVNQFIKDHKDKRIQLYRSVEHKGKTNAQNEAQKLVDSEILVMTDANSMMDEASVKELVSSFSDPEIVYVSGRLAYGNINETATTGNEGTYWNLDLFMREIESEFQTITAGNGAIYACRNKSYFDFNPINCHDSAMPLHYALQGKRCIYNKDAIATEKAGESEEDELKRKIRMNRDILHSMVPSLRVFNIFKYRWFSFFYFGHRTTRYSLWLNHSLALISNIIICITDFNNVFYLLTLIGQVLFIIISVAGYRLKFSNKIFSIIAYYGMTVYAQLKGVINICTGQAKPTWDKAESTR